MTMRLTVAAVFVCGVLSAQIAEIAGPARFLVGGVPRLGRVVVYQGGRAAARGELVAWPGCRRQAEFRGFVPAGKFRIGRAGVEPRVDRFSRARAPIEFTDLAPTWLRREGQLVPRFRMRASRDGLAIAADVYRWPKGGLEVRMLLDAGQDFDASRAHVLTWRGVPRQPRIANACGVRVVAGERSRVVVPAGLLRPGDACHVVLLDGDRAVPTRTVLAPTPVARRPRRRLVRVELGPRFRDAIDALFEARPTAWLDRGDFPRRVADRTIWTHGEFDLAFGLLRFGVDVRSARYRELGLECAVHTLGRDVSRPWHATTLRLPVRHGERHGIGVVDPGHVFLEGCVLASVLEVDRLLMARTSAALDELAALIVEHLPRVERLREVVWPLLNLEHALCYWPRPQWRHAADAIVEWLTRCAEGGFGFPVVPENRLRFGRLRIDTWIVCGLLVPGLARAKERGNRTAGSLLGSLASAIARLPRGDVGIATHYVLDPRSGFEPRDADDPCLRAFVVEGLAQLRKLRGTARGQARSVARRLPGQTWDPATRLALLLRLDWLRYFRTEILPRKRPSPRR